MSSTAGRPSATPIPAPRADAADLRAFVAVARSGSVGRAAALLDRTQPSISARIAGLEAAWRTRLFRRAARGMELTPEGARLLPGAESALRGLEELDREAGLPVAAPGELRVGSGDALGRRLLPGALAKLLRAQPDLEIHLREGPGPLLIDALRDGEIDLALVVASPRVVEPEGIDIASVARSTIVLLTPRGWSGDARRHLRRAEVASSDARGLPTCALIGVVLPDVTQRAHEPRLGHATHQPVRRKAPDACESP